MFIGNPSLVALRVDVQSLYHSVVLLRGPVGYLCIYLGLLLAN